MDGLDVFSSGGGVQSTAALVLAAQGRIRPRTFLFSNVGVDSENPDTIRYVREVAMPYARAHGLDLIELARTKKDGSRETLYGRLTRPNAPLICIPLRTQHGGLAKRACTGDFKVSVVGKWLREHGARANRPATVHLGISMDEFQRMRNSSGVKYYSLAYPLIDLRLSRQDCLNIVRDAGLPQPPKSACFFCPFQRMTYWQRLHDQNPALFAKAADLEARINERRAEHKQPAVWLTRKLMPLAKAVGDYTANSLFPEYDDMCESGYCML